MSNAIEVSKQKTITIKEYGDFQTPLSLCNVICEQINVHKFEPTVLVEPSCGKGNFVKSALKIFPSIKTVIAIDVQEFYKEEFFQNLKNSSRDNSQVKVNFILNSFFSINFEDLCLKLNIDVTVEKFLILGNPPWVTNSFLGQISSENIPIKSNKKTKFKSLDALTGKSNFDIAETFITLLYNYFEDKDFFLAMICKTTTTQSVLKNRYVSKEGFTYESYMLDAKKNFGISAQANVFVISKKSKNVQPDLICNVYNLHNPKTILFSYGYTKNNFVANIDLYNEIFSLEGNFIYQWRQGLKHDASSVLLLEKLEPGKYVNKFHEVIDLEDDLIYPLIKSSDIKYAIIDSIRYYILLPQMKLGEDFTEELQKHPKAWRYLQSKKEIFVKRKSKIYQHQQEFSLFGIGEYTFKPFKVVVSGFYKKLQFSIVQPFENKPVMLDDTCYSLSFDLLEEAVFVWILLQTTKAKTFFNSLVFLENKRPYKKELLQRLDLVELLKNVFKNELLTIFKGISKNYPNLTFETILDFGFRTNQVINNIQQKIYKK